MEPYIIRQRVDLARPGNLQHWPDMMMIEDDANAHCWVVSVYRDGEPVDLTGCKAIGWFTRNDKKVVPVDGAIVGNVISITLDEACYAVHGDLYALLKVYTSGITITLARVRYYVAHGVSDNIYDTTGTLPSVQELLSLVESLKAYDDVKLDANLGAANAGMLLYVSATGAVLPLSIGGGLEIKNGVLSVTGAGGSNGTGGSGDSGENAVLLTVETDGAAFLTGATLTVDENGAAALTGTSLTVDEVGAASIA